jgi:hypothetical protein
MRNPLLPTGCSAALAACLGVVFMDKFDSRAVHFYRVQNPQQRVPVG